MKQSARALEFEKAALIRDRIVELRKEMVIEEGQQFVKQGGHK
jgi:protein-arginine kinase activator protein McsA